MEQWLGVLRMLSNESLPQQLLCKYELNCEYCNINLARNKKLPDDDLTRSKHVGVF